MINVCILGIKLTCGNETNQYKIRRLQTPSPSVIQCQGSNTYALNSDSNLVLLLTACLPQCVCFLVLKGIRASVKVPTQINRLGYATDSHPLALNL